MLKSIFFIFISLFFSTQSFAQSTPLQGGPWTPGHAPMYVGSGSAQPVIQDSGPASGGGLGLGLGEQLLQERSSTNTYPALNAGTGPYGTNWCDYDAPITNANGYHYLCLGPNAQGGGLIIYGAGGNASPLPLFVQVNGVQYQFPFTLNSVTGPSTSNIGDIAVWGNTTGTLLLDSKFPIQVPINQFPDPNLQVSNMSAVTAQSSNFIGTVSPLTASSFSWNGDYSTGTISVTNGSSAVTGSGTNWSTSNIQAGDWIEIPTNQCNGRVAWYPIYSINSTTSLTLGQPGGTPVNYGSRCSESTTSNVAYISTGYYSRYNGSVTPEQQIPNGPRTITVNTGGASTYNLKVNDLVSWSVGSDQVLTCKDTRVLSVIQNTSFTIRPEYTCGRPSSMLPTTYTITRQGDYTGSSGSNVSIGLQKFANGSSWPVVILDDTPTNLQNFKGVSRVVLFQKVTSNTEYLYWQAPVRSLPVMGNKQFSSGAAVYIPFAVSGASAQSYIFDGTTFSYGNLITTVATRQWTGANATLGASPSQVQMGVQLNGPAGTWFEIGEFFQTSGLNYTSDGVFSTEPGQIVTASSSYSPWNGQEVIGPVTEGSGNTLYETGIDFYQLSNGLIGPGVSSVWALLEGQADAAGAALGFSSYPISPAIFGCTMYQQVAQSDSFPGAYMTSSCFLPLSNGFTNLITAPIGQRFENLDFDISKFELYSSTQK